MKNFQCNELFHTINDPILDINKININLTKCICLDDTIPNQFIILKIYNEFINKTNFIIIKGKVFDNLKFDLFNLKILLIYPKKTIKCFIKSTNKIVQAYIYCNIGKEKYNKILIYNQIIYSDNCNESLLLINKEIYYQNYQIISNKTIDMNIIKQKSLLLRKTFNKFDLFIYVILVILIFFKVRLIKH